MEMKEGEEKKREKEDDLVIEGFKEFIRNMAYWTPVCQYVPWENIEKVQILERGEHLDKHGKIELIKVPQRTEGLVMMFCEIISLKEKDEIERKKQEISLLHSNKHPNIIDIYGISYKIKGNFLKVGILTTKKWGTLQKLLDLLDKKEVKEGIFEKGIIFNNEIKRKMIFGITAGLLYLRNTNIHYYNLKPENIILDEKLNPRIYPFEEKNINTNITNSIYKAPEIIENKEENNEKTEIYNFAIIINSILEEKEAWREIKNKKEEIEQLVLEGKRPKLIEGKEYEKYREIIERGWSQEANKRPTIEEIMEILIKKEEMLSNASEEEIENYKTYVISFIPSYSDKIIKRLNKKVEEQRKKIEKYKDKENKGNIVQYIGKRTNLGPNFQNKTATFGAKSNQTNITDANDQQNERNIAICLKENMKDMIDKELIRLIFFRKDLIENIKPFLNKEISEENLPKQYQNITFMNFLNENEIKVNINKKEGEEISNENKNKLIEIIEEDNLEALQQETEKQKNMILKESFFEIDNMQIPILHYCVMKKAMKCFKFLILNGADPSQTLFYEERGYRSMTKKGYEYKWDCISVAVCFGEWEMMKILEERGIDKSKNPSVWEAAALTHRNKLLKLLISNKEGISNFKECIENGMKGAKKSNNLKGFKLLIKETEIPANILAMGSECPSLIHIHHFDEQYENDSEKYCCHRDDPAFTKLHFAAKINDLKMCSYLILQGENVNAKAIIF